MSPSLLSMKKLSLFVASLCGAVSMFASESAPVLLVNPLMGTDSSGGFSHGNEYPAIGVPFPMNTWAPYTQPQRDSFFYQYSKKQIRGLRQTHQPRCSWG